ncbi:MmgE/PrpD family protein [Saccharopolyspora sp. CA-218241]|uniref:MmgE/PrpD family protein n=1 Tax=Saccharopolyspora sp. CA-218241 TaxID=3240027 RepID=UPI003D9815F0
MDAHAGLTWHVAQWIVEQQARPLPAELDRHLRRMTLDAVAGMVASSVGPVTGAVARHARSLYPGDAVTAIGRGPASVLGACLVNGTSGHGIESDEGYTPGSMHPTSVVLPVVFALGESLGADAGRVRVAAAIGMELACRIAAAGHPATRDRHFHNTPLGGVFGAAAAAAVLRGLSVTETANALGIAGSHAGGLFEFLGGSAEIKRFHPGKAARDGIAAADLAASGLTGPTTVLEGVDGYFAAYAGAEWFPERVRGGLGEEWVLRKTYVKPYPCCRHLHGAIDGALELRREHGIDPASITAVRVGTFPIAARHSETDVDTILQAQLSLPYAVAVALTRGAVTLTDFGADARGDTAVRALADKVSVTVDPDADAAYPGGGRPARTTLELTGGRTCTTWVQHPYGEPANPLSDEALERKVRGLCEPVVGITATTELIDAVRAFDDLGFLAAVDRAIRAAAG